MRTEIINKLKRNDRLTDEFELKSNTFSIFISILLSKEIFPRNNDIRFFIEQFSFAGQFKEYLFASRTQLIARLIRIIDSSEPDQLKHYNQTLMRYYEVEEKKKIIEKYDKKEVDEIINTLNRFSRKKKK
jgi:hypothetical protein